MRWLLSKMLPCLLLTGCSKVQPWAGGVLISRGKALHSMSGATQIESLCVMPIWKTMTAKGLVTCNGWAYLINDLEPCSSRRQMALSTSQGIALVTLGLLVVEMNQLQLDESSSPLCPSSPYPSIPKHSEADSQVYLYYQIVQQQPAAALQGSLRVQDISHWTCMCPIHYTLWHHLRLLGLSSAKTSLTGDVS